jgi:hypothetical protein
MLRGRSRALFVCSCCCPRSIARAICSCSSAIFVKPCSRKRCALARCHFTELLLARLLRLVLGRHRCPLEGWRWSLRPEWESCPAKSWSRDAVPRLRQSTPSPLKSLLGEGGNPRHLPISVSAGPRTWSLALEQDVVLCPKRFYRQQHNRKLLLSYQDWRRVATRYDKVARNFLAAATLIGALF